MLVRPITKQFTRNTLLVLAEDVNSGEILRSSVIVDVISTIRIWTNTKQIYLNDVPGMFKVVAYDLYGTVPLIYVFLRLIDFRNVFM